MAVLSRLDIEISANSARFQQEIQNVSATSRRAAAQLQREQQQQAQSRLQIERQYASQERQAQIDLTDEIIRIRRARFNPADEARYTQQAIQAAQRRAAEVAAIEQNKARESAEKAATNRLQIERQYASDHRKIEIDLAHELERIRAAGFNHDDQNRLIQQARERAQAQVDALASQTEQSKGLLANMWGNATDTYNKAKLAYMGIAGAVGAVSAAVGFLIKDQIELANQLNQVALKANTSASAIQKYSIGATATGIEMDKLGDIFKDTQDKVGDFLTTGGGEMKDFFDNVAPKVGVTADQFRKLSGPDALQLYFNSLEKANLSQNEMVFYMEAIADEASALIPLLHDNAAGFKAWEKAAENAGAKMDEKTLRATQDLQTSTKLLGMSYQGVKNQIAAQFMPVLSDLAANMVKDATLKEQAAAAGKTLAEGFKFIVATGYGVVGIFKLIGSYAGAMGAAILHPLDAFNIMKSAWEDAKSIVADVNKSMDATFNLGASGRANSQVTQLTNYTIATEKYKNMLGETGKQIQDNKKATEDAAKSAAKLGDTQLAVYAAWKKAGLSDQWAKVMTAEVGRENDYNAKYLFGFHRDAANGQVNGGMLSWQKSRGTQLASFLTAQGLLKDGKIEQSQAALDAMAKFAINEIMTNPAYAKTKNAILGNANIDTQSAFVITGDNYVKWDRSGRAVLGASGAAKHAARRDNYYRQIAAKSGLANGTNLIQDAQKQIDEQQKLEEQKLALQAKYSAESEKRAAEHAKNVAEIEKTYTNPNDPMRKKLLDQEAADYAHDVNEYELAQAKKTASFTDFKKTERELIIQNANFEAREKANDKNLTLEQKILAMDSIAEQRDLKLKAIDLQEAKERQAANAGHQTAIENIKAEAQLQRDELALNISMAADLRQAKLDAINQAEQAALDKARRDFESELSGITSYAKSEVQKIRDDFTARRSAVDQRTDINDAQKSDLRNALAGQQNDAIRIARKSAADPYNSMMAEFNGTSELLNLKNQLDQRLEIIKKAKAEEVATVEQAEKAKEKAERNYWYASYQLQATQSASLIDSVANMGKIMFGETSSSYKRLFALSQSFVMAQAGLNMYKAISDGWAQGATLPQKLAAAATAGTEMLKIIQAAQQIKMQGFMDGGYTGNIPTNARAGYVHGQEYVFDAPSTKAIGVQNLDRIRKGEGIGGSTNINVNVTVNSDGSSSVESQQQLGKNLGDAINAAVQKALLKERRQGGLLSGAR